VGVREVPGQPVRATLLAALRSQRHITKGVVFDKDGQLFAEYHRVGTGHDAHEERPGDVASIIQESAAALGRPA